MKLIVGLGNPGQEYEKTRHNAGFLAIDRLAARYSAGQAPRARFQGLTSEAEIPGAGRCLLLKPMTYMNRSGQSVIEAVQFYKIDPESEMFVIVDDVALPCGALRIRADGGDGGHNGLTDIARRLSYAPFARCRVGIDQSPSFMAQSDYVTGRFTDEQWEAITPALDTCADAAEEWAREGVTAAMNKFNTRKKKPAEPEARQEEDEARNGEQVQSE